MEFKVTRSDTCCFCRILRLSPFYWLSLDLGSYCLFNILLDYVILNCKCDLSKRNHWLSRKAPVPNTVTIDTSCYCPKSKLLPSYIPKHFYFYFFITCEMKIFTYDMKMDGRVGLSIKICPILLHFPFKFTPRSSHDWVCLSHKVFFPVQLVAGQICSCAFVCLISV